MLRRLKVFLLFVSTHDLHYRDWNRSLHIDNSVYQGVNRYACYSACAAFMLGRSAVQKSQISSKFMPQNLWYYRMKITGYLFTIILSFNKLHGTVMNLIIFFGWLHSSFIFVYIIMKIFTACEINKAIS